jgi:hypothetical protein
MRSLKAGPSWDLSSLNTFIAQQENFLRGPLVALRAEDGATVLEIDDKATDKPEKNTVITIGAPPAGATVIGSGEVYINGNLAKAIAYRPA